MKSCRVTGMVLAASLACCVGMAQADTVNLVPNGGFTTEAEVGAWANTGGVSWGANDGSPDGPSARLDNGNWLYQPNVTAPALVAGQTYQLSFLATWVDGGSGTLTAGVSWGPKNTQGAYTNEYTETFVPTKTWQQYSVLFNATAADVGQSFQPEFLGSNTTRFGIDSVSVHTVPEPSAVMLGVAGILGLLAYAWRKRT